MYTRFSLLFLSQSGSVGANPSSFSAPPVVPHSGPPLQGVAGGLGADNLYIGRLSESSGMVPPTTQEDPPTPHMSVHDDLLLLLGWVS